MSSRSLQRYEGSCHCGSVRFEIQTDFPELTMCDCSICRRKNALMVKVHESNFKLLAGEESLTEYQFHTRTARHFFCKVCGIYPFTASASRPTTSASTSSVCKASIRPAFPCGKPPARRCLEQADSTLCIAAVE